MARVQITTPRIPIPRAILERLLTLLTKSYARHPTREVKQVSDTIKHLLTQRS